MIFPSGRTIGSGERQRTPSVSKLILRCLPSASAASCRCREAVYTRKLCPHLAVLHQLSHLLRKPPPQFRSLSQVQWPQRCRIHSPSPNRLYSPIIRFRRRPPHWPACPLFQTAKPLQQPANLGAKCMRAFGRKLNTALGFRMTLPMAPGLTSIAS